MNPLLGWLSIVVGFNALAFVMNKLLSRHGPLRDLTPCVEVDRDEVNMEEPEWPSLREQYVSDWEADRRF